MAKMEHVIKAELNPQTPIPDIMQVITVMMQSNPGHEAAILKGVAEGVSILAARFEQKEGERNAVGTEPADRK